MSSAIQPVWALHETTNEVFAIAKGILTAATSDNVQPLALMACEAFGATLAICKQTQLLVEKEARKHHTSYVVKFLKSKIGYSAHDSAFQLSSTNAGLRFLSLVAALLCTYSNFVGAEALMLMIESSSQKDQPLPTLLQLQDLLDALDYKLLRTRFAEDIIGWETFLSEYLDTPPWFRQRIRSAQMHPGVAELEKLVATFRTLERVGEGDNASVRITAGLTCPWLVAFIKWCLGVPPTIIMVNGASILSQPKSKVILVVNIDLGKYMMTIEIVRDIESPAELWSTNMISMASPLSQWTRMVSISQFGQRQLGNADFIDSSGYQALCQALLYTTKLVKSRFNFGNRKIHDYLEFAPDLWPSDKKIAATFTEYLNLSSPLTRLGDLKETERFTDLPLVEAYLRNLENICSCRSCNKERPTWDECFIKLFKELVVDFTHDILVLSLFDTIEPILVAIKPPPEISFIDMRASENTRTRIVQFDRAVNDIIFESIHTEYCPISTIFDAALRFIGHTDPARINTIMVSSHEYDNTWIASAYRGQIVYPNFFDSMNLSNKALLSLGGGPGVLQHQGHKYDLVVSDRLPLPKIGIWRDIPVSAPLNLADGEQLEWQVKVGNRCLKLGCGITSSFKEFCPMVMLSVAAKSLFIPNCIHEKDSLLVASDPQCYYITPYFHKRSSDNEVYDGTRDTDIGIVAVAGNEGLRCFALLSDGPAVIRQSACLQCSIDICRRVGFNYVIA